MPRVLIVHPDALVLQLISESVGEISADAVVRFYANVEEALEQLAQATKPFDLVITNISVPMKKQDARSEINQNGLDLLRKLPEVRHPKTPGILIVPERSAKMFMAVQDLWQCRLVESGVDMEAQLLEALSSRMKPPAPERPASVQVTIDLGLRHWEYRLERDDCIYADGGDLMIDAAGIQKLINLSRGVNLSDDGALRSVGQLVAEYIFQHNPKLLTSIEYAAGLAGGIDRKVICFKVEESVHDALLEAVVLDDQEDFWMLRMPIYRRLIAAPVNPLQRRALFSGKDEDRERFRALIIQSTAAGSIELGENQSVTLPDLKEVENEAEWLEKNLPNWNGDVYRLTLDKVPDNSSFKLELQKLLKQEWSLVHYIGHCHLDEQSSKRYIFCPGYPPEAIEIGVFANWLVEAKARFLFLSGCRSSEAGFVFKLAQQQIPAVLGFYRAIADDDAPKFTELFYQGLFDSTNGRCIERAFLSARKAMRQVERDRPKMQRSGFWAAPLLVMQTSS